MNGQVTKNNIEEVGVHLAGPQDKNPVSILY